MREAHAIRQDELKKEIHDSGMGFLELPLESLPTGGIFILKEHEFLYVQHQVVILDTGL